MSKHDLTIEPPLMNGAGSLGFSPDPYCPVDWSKLGAFVTHPISLTPRTPAHGKRFMAFPGGFVLHTGYPNAGIKRVVRNYAGHWSRAPIPVIVHLLARSAEEVAIMTRLLESVEGVMGLEVGMDSDVNADMVGAFTHAATGELPVIIRLPMERSIELAPGAMNAGADAVSLAPPRGSYPMAGEMIHGRVCGPALPPPALRMVYALTQM